jgi:hypothetical protein
MAQGQKGHGAVAGCRAKARASLTCDLTSSCGSHSNQRVRASISPGHHVDTRPSGGTVERVHSIVTTCSLQDALHDRGGFRLCPRPVWGLASVLVFDAVRDTPGCEACSLEGEARSETPLALRFKFATVASSMAIPSMISHENQIPCLQSNQVGPMETIEATIGSLRSVVGARNDAERARQLKIDRSRFPPGVPVAASCSAL